MKLSWRVILLQAIYAFMTAHNITNGIERESLQQALHLHKGHKINRRFMRAYLSTLFYYSIFCCICGRRIISSLRRGDFRALTLYPLEETNKKK